MTAADGKPEIFSRIVEIASLDPDGADYVIEPNEAEREAIAGRLDIPALKELRGAFKLTPIRGRVNVLLLIEAEAVRSCVVSLEPMAETIREYVEMQFSRAFEETESDEAQEDGIFREPLIDDQIDLGELLTQHLSLSLAPYPRREGAKSLAENFRDATSASPFSVLKGLIGRET